MKQDWWRCHQLVPEIVLGLQATTLWSSDCRGNARRRRRGRRRRRRKIKKRKEQNRGKIWFPSLNGHQTYKRYGLNAFWLEELSSWSSPNAIKRTTCLLQLLLRLLSSTVFGLYFLHLVDWEAFIKQLENTSFVFGDFENAWVDIVLTMSR